MKNKFPKGKPAKKFSGKPASRTERSSPKRSDDKTFKPRSGSSANKKDSYKSDKPGRSSGRKESGFKKTDRYSDSRGGKPPRKFNSSRSADFKTGRKESDFKKTDRYSDKRSSKPPRKFTSSGSADFKTGRKESGFKKTDRYSDNRSGKPPRKFNSSGSADFKKGGYRSDKPDKSFGRKKEGFKNSERPFSKRSDKPAGKFSPRSGSSSSGKDNFINKRPGRSFGEKEEGDYKKKNPYKKSRSFTKNKTQRAEEGQDSKPFREKTGKPEGKFEKKKFTDEKKSFSGKTRAKLQAKEKGEPEKIRLNRYIANAGVCSRRDADIMIQDGMIKVNGKVVTEMGYIVGPNDSVKYGNRILNREKPVYLLLNKPKDFITTTDDPDERKTVMDLVKNACKERVYPVGRLDRNTTGLLLLTNDGELAEKLTHPSYGVKKLYQADLDRPISPEDFEKIRNGLQLEDGPVRVDEIAIINPERTSLGIELHEGRNRIVRRIFEHLGYDVVKLDRVMYAGLTKKDLPRGHWRMLTEKEVVKLKYF